MASSPPIGARVAAWFDANVKAPFMRLSAHQRIAACAVGAVGGMFPVPMVTTPVCMALALLMALNPPQLTLAIALNLLLGPVELLAIPSLARFAAYFSGADATAFTAGALMSALQDGFGAMLSASASLLVHAVVSWVVLFLWILPLVHATRPRHREKKVAGSNLASP